MLLTQCMHFAAAMTCLPLLLPALLALVTSASVEQQVALISQLVTVLPDDGKHGTEDWAPGLVSAAKAALKPPVMSVRTKASRPARKRNTRYAASHNRASKYHGSGCDFIAATWTVPPLFSMRVSLTVCGGSDTSASPPASPATAPTAA